MGKVNESNKKETDIIINLQDISKNEHLYSVDEGLLIVFNQVNFHDVQKYKSRMGANVDLDRIMETFSHFSFQIEVRVDFTVAEIFSALHNLPFQYNLKEISSLLIIFLTYGEGHDRLMAADESFHVKDIEKILQPNSLRELAGKPKIIMINASRGNKLNKSIKVNEISSSDSPMETKISTSVAYNLENYRLYDKDIGSGYSGFYPLNADFLLCFSTFENHLSFRNENGSWFIQEFCSVLDFNKEGVIEIFDALTMTCRRMIKRRTDAVGELDNVKQVPMFTSTLTRKFLFFPNLLINFLKTNDSMENASL